MVLGEKENQHAINHVTSTLDNTHYIKLIKWSQNSLEIIILFSERKKKPKLPFFLLCNIKYCLAWRYPRVKRSVWIPDLSLVRDYNLDHSFLTCKMKGSKYWLVLWPRSKYTMILSFWLPVCVCVYIIYFIYVLIYIT